MNVLWIFIIVLLLLAVFGAPGVGILKHNFGYAPSVSIGTILVIILILWLLGVF